MILKKFIAAATSAVLALGIFTALPESPVDISVSAEDFYTTKDGIMINTDENGDKYVYGFALIGLEKNLSIPTDVKYIGENAFYHCSQELESVKIPANVTEIRDYAFSDCFNLKTVTFAPNSKCKIIGDYAFTNCLKLTEINLPNSITQIGIQAFEGCTELTSLTVPAKAKIDPDSHFAGYTTSGKKADGKTEEYFIKGYDKDDNEIGITYTQKPITLYVTKGSDGEKYAKSNGIAYKYGTAPKSTSTSTTSTAKKLAAPTGIKGTVSEDKIVLNWNKVDGAKAYRVYKYDSKTGKYVKYKDVSGTKCTVTGLKSGTKYSFKVYALTSENGKFVPQTPSKAVTFTTKEYNTDYITMD